MHLLHDHLIIKIYDIDSDTNIDSIRETCEILFSYSCINNFSTTSITRIKVLFHNTNIFVDLSKLIQRIEVEWRKNYVISIMKAILFYRRLCPYVYK